MRVEPSGTPQDTAGPQSPKKLGTTTGGGGGGGGVGGQLQHLQQQQQLLQSSSATATNAQAAAVGGGGAAALPASVAAESVQSQMVASSKQQVGPLKRCGGYEWVGRKKGMNMLACVYNSIYIPPQQGFVICKTY